MRVLGLMSGTSADGIDAVLVEFKGDPSKPKWKILNTGSYEYPSSTRDKIIKVGQGLKISSKDWLELAEEITELNAFAAKACDPNSTAEVVGCHGQTVFHRSVKNSQRGGTLQILLGPLLSKILDKIVIYDFRSNDIASGGHGAPLVAIVDEALVGRLFGWRGILNLGGIANLTIIPPKTGIDKTSKCLGWDCGPANSLMDLAIQESTNSSSQFDQNGLLASLGTPKLNIIEKWLKEPFFHLEPPRSTGREQFGFQDLQIRKKEVGNISKEDLLSTLATFTTSIIAQDLDNLYRTKKIRLIELLIAGGGTRNLFLMKQLQKQCCGIYVRHINEIGIPFQYREALAFATLSWWNLLGKRFNPKYITGADKSMLFGVRIDP
ncbi:anhydro-N-acetylmuramic acid kinase [Prochlorococcus marinus]|uniref:Anhydro-N-acetylmuramic acid kinase n=1 Tax=Prochlorococcus marinus XMU1408 TaxID=2213228 RepID=A0A318R5W1_PROMR|nr:anhydro-N-acetylmuramic acid kinase [Prochlorococcus marinus]MBW3041145.1 anhydro-N-acetylmuramic acid kinase [Prochlorococcus marinus str. XMU1408]PYE03743.1 anhydro-N-acetylmuramic acid kinase [Prochlorococcus marinus XMU1408]